MYILIVLLVLHMHMYIASMCKFDHHDYHLQSRTLTKDRTHVGRVKEVIPMVLLPKFTTSK